jgi:hypothetical protein
MCGGFGPPLLIAIVKFGPAGRRAVRFANARLPSVPFQIWGEPSKWQNRCGAEGLRDWRPTVWSASDWKSRGKKSRSPARKPTFCASRRDRSSPEATILMRLAPSPLADLRDAGAEAVDEEVVIDGNLISSRSTRRPAGVTSSERHSVDRHMFNY